MRIKLPGILIILVLAAIAYFVFIKPKGGVGKLFG